MSEADTDTTAANKRLLEDIFAGLGAGDSKPLVAAMGDDFRWTMIGSTPWSRTWDGKEAVVRELFPALRAALGEPIITRAERVVADGDHVVVQARGDNRTRAGVAYANQYCFVFRVSGGRLREVTEYFDTELVRNVLGPPRT